MTETSDRQGQLLQQARLLIPRLERISADSSWARRASGQRGNLLKWVERLEANDRASRLSPEDLDHFHSLLDSSFDLLKKAAQEYPES
jgi:hypothetical protein